MDTVMASQPFQSVQEARHGYDHTEPCDNSQQLNHEGTYTWKVDDMIKLQRYLYFGSVNGRFDSTVNLTTNTIQIDLDFIHSLIQNHRGAEVVDTIKTFSMEGKTVKQSYILRALAYCARINHNETERLAYEVVSDVCRIPTHLFEFLTYVEEYSHGTGWGRLTKQAVTEWYRGCRDNPRKLAYRITKYRRRKNWSHKDVLRKAHVNPAEIEHSVAFILRYVAKGFTKACEQYVPGEHVPKDLVEFLRAVTKARCCRNAQHMVELIREHKLVREHVPTCLLKDHDVLKALLAEMPITALVRALGKLTSSGLLEAGSDEERIVIDKLRDSNLLEQARLHPMFLYQAAKTYQNPNRGRGRLHWVPNPVIYDALNEAFYRAFGMIESTNKRYLLAVDIHRSMSAPVIDDSMISMSEAAAAVMMTITRVEEQFEVVTLSGGPVLQPLNIRRDSSVSDVLEIFRGTQPEDESSSQGKDYSWLVKYAAENKKRFDVCILFTDNVPSGSSGIHLAQAFRDYRAMTGKWHARLIVVSMTSNDFTVADPSDPGMLDIVGLDSDAALVMRSFIMGELD